MHTFYFEKLDVWKCARELIVDIYKSSERFPDTERFGIVSQLRRAGTSIAANIAEGFSRSSEKEKIRFINVSFSSCIEVINFLIISRDLCFLDEEHYVRLRSKTEEITNKLNALTNTLSKHLK